MFESKVLYSKLRRKLYFPHPAPTLSPTPCQSRNPYHIAYFKQTLSLWGEENTCMYMHVGLNSVQIPFGSWRMFSRDQTPYRLDVHE